MPSNYRADHIGSFLRPAKLLEARQTATPQELQAVEDGEILRVLAKQRDLGFAVATDGEFRRRNFMSDLTDAVEGFDISESATRKWETAQAAQGAESIAASKVAGIVTSKLKRVRPLTRHELPFLKTHCPVAIKITLPSATQFPAISFKAGVTDRAYKNHSELLWEIVEIMKNDLRELSAGGVNYIQIDAPRYSYYMDPKWRDWIRAEMRMDPGAALDEAIRADQACFQAARSPGVALGIHLCRGNNRSHWYAEGGYDAIAEKLFNSLDVDRFLLEYDDARSGTFEPLRFVPRGKIVVLGLVSSKVPELEDRQMLLRRVNEASKYVPLENLALSPQCGFASTAEGNLLTEEDQWAKLRLVIDTAGEIWRN